MWLNGLQKESMPMLVLIWLCFGNLVLANAPEKGKILFELSDSKICRLYSKTLYNGSWIMLNVKDHTGVNETRISWVAKGMLCFKPVAFTGIEAEDKFIREHYFDRPWETLELPVPGFYTGSDCDDHYKDYPKKWQSIGSIPLKQQLVWWPVDSTAPANQAEHTSTHQGVKRDTEAAESVAESIPKSKAPKNAVLQVTTEATYSFYVCIDGETKGKTFEVTVEMKSDKGYLSAHEFPLLSFYMIMCIVYSLFGVVWLVLSACNYQDLLRIQFWIGGVIFLGMIEKAVFFAEYNGVNITGESTVGAYKFAEVVSSMKKAVARMLVIVVSLGFGIVKPRLGPMLYRVIAAGVLYFIFASAEAIARSDTPIHDPENKSLTFIFIPLAVIDSVICWWIFISLLQTMKTLRLRRNVVKLSLYRHFSNTIIFCVLASIGLLLWNIRVHNTACIADWSELWLENAMWHILFSVILFVIMVLWRPNANNQRYAYSPMIDGNDSDMEEQEELMLGSGAVENIKSRAKVDSDYTPADDFNKTEEDLKWIEENIPQTVADSVAPALIDSDEDEMTTKYEMSKIE